nr:uncharacterized protein LOC110070620 [Pogona vitticeps]
MSVTQEKDMQFLGAVLFLAIFEGIWGQETVTQKDRFANTTEGEPVHLNCSYQGTPNNLQWYQQNPDGHIVHVAILFQTKTESFGRFDMNLNKQEKTTWLRLKNPRLEDSGVYFCAMSHSVAVRHAGCPFRFRQGHLQILLNFRIFGSYFGHQNRVKGNRARSQDAVEQEPLKVTREGENTTIACRYKTSNFYSLHWYRQYPGEGLEFLLQKVTDNPNLKDHMQGDLDKKKQLSRLSFRGARLRDDATYFCALAAQ